MSTSTPEFQEERARRRERYASGLDRKAYAVQMPDKQWFVGFGFDKDTGAPRTKVHPQLYRAQLMVSTQRCQDYIRRLAERGYPGAQIHTVEVSQ